MSIASIGLGLGLGAGLDVLYVCDVIIKINVRYVIINRFLRYIQ